MHKLTSQESLKLQLKSIVDDVLTSTAPEQVVPQLQPYFETIDDLPFLINTALILCQQNITFKALVYLLQKKAYASADDTSIQSLCDIMNKIDILEYIYFRESNAYETVNIFALSFVEICTMFISKSDFDLASICWLKYSCLKQMISPNEILGIMNAIPHNIKMGALINWLRNFCHLF